MKYVLLMCLLVAATGTQAANPYRDFTSTDGKTIRGCIRAYNASKEVVTIERDNRRTATVPITVFSETDQTYIRDWEIMRCFETEQLFKIFAKRRKGDDDESSYQSTYSERDVETTGYEIILKNRSSPEMRKLKVKYCIYYEQEEKRAHDQVCNQGVPCGDISIDSFAPKSEELLRTEDVTTYKEELSSGARWVSGAENVQRGNVHGVWIRIYLKLPSGQEGMREYCLPDSLDNSKAWMTSSIRAGMN